MFSFAWCWHFQMLRVCCDIGVSDVTCLMIDVFMSFWCYLMLSFIGWSRGRAGGATSPSPAGNSQVVICFFRNSGTDPPREDPYSPPWNTLMILKKSLSGPPFSDSAHVIEMYNRVKNESFTSMKAPLPLQSIPFDFGKFTVNPFKAA